MYLDLGRCVAAISYLRWSPCLSSSTHHAVCVDTVTLDLIKLYGHMYLDLGRVENVALLRLLNTHNREFNDRGTKTLRIDVLPVSLSNPTGGSDPPKTCRTGAILKGL